MIYFLVLIFLLIANPAWAAIAVVQAVGAGSTGADSVTTADITTTSGNLFICDSSYYFDAGGAFSSISDSKSNSYTASITDQVSSGDTFSHGRQDYKENGSGGAAHNFTANATGGGPFLSIICKEVSGALTSGALDKVASKIDNNGNTGLTSSSTAMTSQADELLAGGGTVPGNQTGDTSFTAQSGFTENDEITGVSGVTIGLTSASKVVAATGTYAFTFDTTNSFSGIIGWVSTWKASGAPPARMPRAAMILQ